nr:ATP synthase membrane subunit DAPIT, mitochondrial-like [Arvicanthis niloticus]
MEGPETNGQFQITGIQKHFGSYAVSQRPALLVLHFNLRPKILQL